jgi:hypothetical protein
MGRSAAVLLLLVTAAWFGAHAQPSETNDRLVLGDFEEPYLVI